MDHQRSKTKYIRSLFIGLTGLISALRCSAQAVPPASVDTATINRWWVIGSDFLSINTDSAWTYSRQIIEQSRQRSYPTGLAKGYALAASVLRNQGEFDSSIHYAQQALTIFEAQPQPEGIANVYNLLALTYKRMGDAQNVKPLSRKAMRYAEMARQSALKTRNYSELSRAYNTLGITARDMGQFSVAKANYLQAIRIELQHQPRPSYLPIGYANYGQILMDADKNYPLAIHYYQKAIALYEQQHSLTGLEHAYRNLSWAYRQQGKDQPAMATAEKALALGRLVNDPHRLVNSLQAAYLAYRQAGQYQKALVLLEEWKKRGDSLVTLEKTRSIARLELAYASQKQALHIRQLDAENKRDRRQMTYLTVGLLIVLTLLGVLGWQYQSLRRSRFQIRQQATQLTLAIKELHHRVKNNLAIVSSLLRLQANQVSDDGVAQAIRVGQQRVEAMSLIHQRLYQTDRVTTVNIREYLTDLTHSLMQAYGYTSADVDLHINITHAWLEVDTAVPLGLIVNELVTNSFKHAYASVDRPMLRISLSDRHGLLLEVHDNGPGVTAADWATTEPCSFGKRLITSLCAQLDGSVEVKQQNGALFQMRFAEVT